MDTETTVTALAALAQEHRLAIFRYLVRQGPNGDAVSNIAAHLGLPGATLSFHLKTLKLAGLLSVRRESRSLIYSANFDRMNNLLAYLMEDCCGGQCGATVTCDNPSTLSGDKQ